MTVRANTTLALVKKLLTTVLVSVRPPPGGPVSVKRFLLFDFDCRDLASATKMAEYDFIPKGPLKLKGVDGGIKKKKKKNKDAKKVWEQVSNDSNPEEMVQATPKPLPRTKAQQAFDKMQEKRKMQRILEKASKTHKQCVEEFNNHLDKLTEHYDIPKVSWTK